MKAVDALDHRSGAETIRRWPKPFAQCKFDIRSRRRIAPRMIGRNLLVVLGVNDQGRLTVSTPRIRAGIEVLDPPPGQLHDHAFERCPGPSQQGEEVWPKPLKSHVISLGAPISTMLSAICAPGRRKAQTTRSAGEARTAERMACTETSNPAEMPPGGIDRPHRVPASSTFAQARRRVPASRARPPRRPRPAAPRSSLSDNRCVIPSHGTRRTRFVAPRSARRFEMPGHDPTAGRRTA